METSNVKQGWARRFLPPQAFRFLKQDEPLLDRMSDQFLKETLVTLLAMARKNREECPWIDFFAYAMAHTKASYAQLYQDLWVLWSTGEKRGGYFVDIGAFDGVTLSNTALLERDFGWQGILAEPNPAFAAILPRERNCFISNRCVWSSSNEKLSFKQVAEPEYSTLENVDPQDSHEDSGRREKFRMFEVDSISLNDLLGEAGAPKRMDFLSLDTEGSEIDILNAFDFQTWSFDRICVEHNFTPRRAEIHALLTQNGYVRTQETLSQWDDWYVGK